MPRTAFLGTKPFLLGEVPTGFLSKSISLRAWDCTLSHWKNWKNKHSNKRSRLVQLCRKLDCRRLLDSSRKAKHVPFHDANEDCGGRWRYCLLDRVHQLGPLPTSRGHCHNRSREHIPTACCDSTSKRKRNLIGGLAWATGRNSPKSLTQQGHPTAIASAHQSCLSVDQPLSWRCLSWGLWLQSFPDGVGRGLQSS